MAVASKIVLRCPQCGTKNRVDPERAAATRARCARCRNPLELPAKQKAPLEVTDANVAELVDRSPLPVFIEFYSQYCLYCQRLEPVMDRLAREVSDRVRVAKLDIDKNRLTAARFGVRATPTLAVIDGGRELDRLEGALPEEQIRYRFWRWLGDGPVS
jgi:thioredoxin 2